MPASGLEEFRSNWAAGSYHCIHCVACGRGLTVTLTHYRNVGSQKHFLIGSVGTTGVLPLEILSVARTA
jgi:hypothetical protein